jgi:hypothetical protein
MAAGPRQRDRVSWWYALARGGEFQLCQIISPASLTSCSRQRNIKFTLIVNESGKRLSSAFGGVRANPK